MRVYAFLFIGAVLFGVVRPVSADTGSGTNATSRHPADILATGGPILTPATPPFLVFLNAQNQVPAETIQAFAARMQSAMRVGNQVRAVDSGKSSAEILHAALAEGTNKVAFSVAIVDRADQPVLLIAPEDRWAIVNVRALAIDKTSGEILSKRIERELWRAACHVMGAANSTFEHCVMKPVFQPEELDQLPLMACPEPYARMQMSWKKAGMQSLRVVPYRKAVEEGWAPPPTNEIQRAVWEDVKKGGEKK